MLIIKVWLLPKLREDQVAELHRDLVAAATSVDGAYVRDEKDVINIFPLDAMGYGLGEDLLVEISEHPTEQVRAGSCNELMCKVQAVVEKMFPDSRVYTSMQSGSKVLSARSFHSQQKVAHHS